MAVDSKVLEDMVRKVLAEILSKNEGCCADARHVDKSGILSVALLKIKPGVLESEVGRFQKTCTI
ncbi:hypothetical protein Holit_02339 [Hollandina sp. SP2]